MPVTVFVAVIEGNDDETSNAIRTDMLKVIKESGGELTDSMWAVDADTVADAYETDRAYIIDLNE
ncbi:hypothetical protein ETD86_12820 [Nonomuraea turkmeniaca]|uniref:Uncharacterized protein n=1 Tax=Nonomuraea turkmeniaca TaxID=103838 RepID=A0A5S4FN43_9ACTN|nr:hypothetical protein [Nonomuraea turkmeniaca]TMR22049.1 hypothetical protein ETD86_12820 [Nonomuraea turkmeniaca]